MKLIGHEIKSSGEKRKQVEHFIKVVNDELTALKKKEPLELEKLSRFDRDEVVEAVVGVMSTIKKEAEHLEKSTAVRTFLFADSRKSQTQTNLLNFSSDMQEAISDTNEQLELSKVTDGDRFYP